MSVKLNRPPKPEESQKDSNFNGKTIPYPGFEPGTSGLAVGSHNHCTIWVGQYDTIIINQVYVGMSELNVPTKLMHLTKATLTIVMCCVKIQNDCSESFETRQGLRQGDVLSTLLPTYKQPAQSTTNKHNYLHMPMI
jgi:hypothetical protein